MCEGDIAAIRRLTGDPFGFPNVRDPLGIAEVPLEYAIYHSPFAGISDLLDLGADPNYGDHAGFPSLIAALSSNRPDRAAVIELLLARGADVEQRGVNNYTPLHWAAAHDDDTMIGLLLSHGADRAARTVIDENLTPLEETRLLGRHRAVAALAGA